ncbi:hypothetical protein CDAR_373411 [Caerostris darwini]|uniref:Uncharacterized protein n=1 Tax=Caerostris darwini TaxID=1538125 RepID=A0AAV4N1P6_9ARAC|nr:hypothetical protein CDAR_373411 [Caerostris darwini]
MERKGRRNLKTKVYFANKKPKRKRRSSGGERGYLPQGTFHCPSFACLWTAPSFRAVSSSSPRTLEMTLTPFSVDTRRPKEMGYIHKFGEKQVLAQIFKEKNIFEKHLLPHLKQTLTHREQKKTKKISATTKIAILNKS